MTEVDWSKREEYIRARHLIEPAWAGLARLWPTTMPCGCSPTRRAEAEIQFGSSAGRDRRERC